MMVIRNTVYCYDVIFLVCYHVSFDIAKDFKYYVIRGIV